MTETPTILRRMLDHEYSWLRIIVVALGLRLALLAAIAGEPLAGDSLYYQQVAIGIVDNGEWDAYWPPGLPLYEAAVTLVFGKSAIWLRLAMLPWFLWLCKHFYQLAYRLHSRMAANLGLVFLAFFPEFIHQSVEPLSYLPAATLLLALLSALQRYFDQRKFRFLRNAGILLGLLILFRPSTALFLLALPPLLVLRRRKLFPAMALIVISGLIISGWLFWIGEQAGRWVPINDANARNLYLGNNRWTPEYKTWYYGSHWTGDPALPEGFRTELDSLDHLPPEVRGKAFTQAALLEIKSAPARFGTRTLSRLRTLIAFDTLVGTKLLASEGAFRSLGFAVLGVSAGMYCCLVAGMLAFFCSGSKRALAGSDLGMIVGFLAVFAIPHFLAFAHPTYHLPMLPLALLLACVWGEEVIHRGMHFPKWRRLGLLALMIAVFIGIQVEWIIRMV